MLELLFTDYTLRTVALGALVIGAVSGALGCFAVLRRQSLIGDAVSHAALPGIALAFLITGSKSPAALLTGAMATGVAAMLLVTLITRTTRIKQDSALGLMLSVFFGWGLVLLTYVQRMPQSNKAGLDRFLFGQAAGLVAEDVQQMALLGGLALVALGLMWKEVKLVSFDPAFAASIGKPVRTLEVALTALIVVAIVVGLETVGVVLMSAMLIAPAAAARQWTRRLGPMVLLAALFGAVAGVIGALISASGARLPTGPLVVLAMTTIAVLSLMFGSERGMIWTRLVRRRRDRRLRARAVLQNLYSLQQQHPEEPEHGHALEVVELMHAPGAKLAGQLAALEHDGMVRLTRGGRWALTDRGLATAEEATSESGHPGSAAEPGGRP